MKWCRRHKPLVGTAIIGLIVSVIGLAASTALVWLARGEAIAQRRLAEQRYALARRAVDDLYDETARKWLSADIWMAPMPSRFLRRALPFYQQFAEDRGTDRTAIWNVGRALLRVGEIQIQLGRKKEAESAIRAPQGVFLELLGAAPSDPELRHDLALCHVRLGEFLLTEDSAGGPSPAARHRAGFSREHHVPA